MACVLFGWVLFACDDMTMLGSYCKALFGQSGGGVSSMSLYYLLTYGVMFLILAIGSTELPRNLWNHWLERKERSTGLVFTLQVIFLVAVLFLTIAFLAADSYNPFLYFRF
jgi:alginate O-acetyltransferase complex protein AlgI